MVPLVPAADMAVPLAAAAETPVTAIGTVPVALAASVTLTTATVPFAIAVWLSPQSRQSAEPLLALQVTLLEAATAALPTETLTLVTLAVG